MQAGDSASCAYAASCVIGQSVLNCYRQFQEHLQLQNVHPLLLTSEHGTPTATCICLITPDGERTMRPHLGAAAELKSAKQLPKGWTQGCRLLHCEGYCLYRPELAAGAMQAAKDAGAEVHCVDYQSKLHFAHHANTDTNGDF